MNRCRREIEADMHDSALSALEQVTEQDGYSLSLYDAAWHQGVIGILASRLKEKFHRPTIVFSPAATAPSRARDAPSRVCTCAMRSTWYPGASPA